METTASRQKWLSTLALLLVLPTIYFITISILKYNFGIDGPYDTSAPLLDRMGINDPLGWNINLLILFGPLLALLISVMQVLGIEWHFTKEHFDFRVTIQRKWFPLIVSVISGMVLVTLFIYLIVENL